ncbi:glycosyltransferase [Blastomonas sp.]|uniref:glycosyltransferase n=1 Tax=Blastomonas sp. TaxID=1909299 RepID=UPI0035941D17
MGAIAFDTISVQLVAVLSAICGTADAVGLELLLFAGTWFLVGALDDLAIDAIWLWSRVKDRLVRRSQAKAGQRAKPQTPSVPHRHAVFVPAWDEADVIGDMIGHCLSRWPGRNYQMFIGVYSNDPATRAAALAGADGDARVHIVTLLRTGPTSKADCLNHLWQAMLAHEHGIM